MASSEDGKYVAVFDIETAARIDEMRGSSRTAKVASLPISCLSVFTMPSGLCFDPVDAARAVESGKMQTFWRENVYAAIDVLLGAELVVTYNGSGFDFPVLKKHVRNADDHLQLLTKSLDVFERVRSATTRWLKLDALLELNGLSKKTANGLEAIRLFAEGRLDELREYCEADVRLTAQLAMLPQLVVAAGERPLPNHVYGIASALHGIRALPPPPSASSG